MVTTLMMMNCCSPPEEEKNKTKSKTRKRNKGVPEDDQLMEEDHSLSLSEDETDKLPASKQREPSSERKMRSKKVEAE